MDSTIAIPYGEVYSIDPEEHQKSISNANEHNSGNIHHGQSQERKTSARVFLKNKSIIDIHFTNNIAKNNSIL